MRLTMIGNGGDTYGPGNQSASTRQSAVKRVDLALNPFGMQGDSFARSRQPKRAFAQTLIEPHTDRSLHRSKPPSDGRIIDTEQSRSRRQGSSSADGEDVAEIVPI